jgi:hypothetical protein
MKYILFCVLEKGSPVEDLFIDLKNKGYNGEYLVSKSIYTLTSDEYIIEPVVLSLKNSLAISSQSNQTFFIILEEEKLKEVKDIITNYTESFKKIKGAIFGWPLSFFSGSF